ncbi:YraN family protein [Flaviaesturariibacter terrae]
MAVHNERGKNGEALAVTWLGRQGFQVLETNWRYGHLEIDVIALREGIPHFVEVKYKSGSTFGPPELKVNRQKYRNVANAAAAWLRRNPQYRDLRIDILAITELKGKEPEYFFIRNVSL